MVRLIFNLNKFQGFLVLKIGRDIILLPPFCLNTALGTNTSVGQISQDHHCHTHSTSPTRASHNIICTNMTRDKARTPKSVGHPVVWLNYHCHNPHLLKERLFVHPLPLNSPRLMSLNEFNYEPLKSNSKMDWISVFLMLHMFSVVGWHKFCSMLIILMLVQEIFWKAYLSKQLMFEIWFDDMIFALTV